MVHEVGLERLLLHHLERVEHPGGPVVRPPDLPGHALPDLLHADVVLPEDPAGEGGTCHPWPGQTGFGRPSDGVVSTMGKAAG